MRYFLFLVGVMCSCNRVSGRSRAGEHQKVAPNNYCTRLKSLQVVSCDGRLVGQGVTIGGTFEEFACLLGQTEDGHTWLYVPGGGQPSFAQAQQAIDEGRVCLAPDAKDFAIYDEEYPGIVYLELALFVRCDSNYCASPEGIPNWHYEPDLMEEYKNSD